MEPAHLPSSITLMTSRRATGVATRRPGVAARRLGVTCLVAVAAWTHGACGYDPAYRQGPVPPELPLCQGGERRCDRDVLQRCEVGIDARLGWVVQDDCAARGLACAGADVGCRPCVPGATTCGGELKNRIDRCRPDGSGYDPGPLCQGEGRACRGGICDDLCAIARERKSNVGCEYWPVHLDNANLGPSSNASAQQYAVIASNPQSDVAANVVVEQDDSEPGQPHKLTVVAKARVTPLNLEVFLLGPHWVDGTTDTLGTGQTDSALSRHAYRLKSDVPIVVYQFNPHDNVNVFSNDASLLKPVEAIGGSPRYVVIGWPQTIAIDSSPEKNFGIHLRNFLTIVGTRESTTVVVKTTAAIVAGGAVGAVPVGGTAKYRLEPFEVLNLETGAFHADFTGSIVEASAPVVVYSGSEASDAPHWDNIAARSCCADHLEEQLDPARTAGRRFIVAQSPNRARAVRAAGATNIGPFDEPEYARVIAVTEGVTHVRTTLPRPDDDFYLKGVGDVREIVFRTDFTMETDGAVHVADLQASQEAAGIPRGFPGGDPSLTIVPPIEQFRADYVFLTPDKYAFEFFTVMAPKGATFLLDGAPPATDACERAFIGPAASPVTGTPLGDGFDVWRCQLSFPTIDLTKPAGKQVGPGRRNDGVHRLQASRPVGLIVYGFDNYVSYAYAAGTELETLTPR